MPRGKVPALRDSNEGQRAPRTESFPWPATKERLLAVLSEFELRYEPRIRGFVRAADEDPERSPVRFVPPLVQLEGAGDRTPDEYARSLGEGLGRYTVLLLQAGATALGLWEDDELLAHKAIKKYVVRGRGRAQPVHLKTKGKSRYGSRLRLQNALRQLTETNEKLQEWHAEFGPSDRVYYSCPVRTWPELFRQSPPPPFERDQSTVRIPLHVHVPDFAEVKRVHRTLTRGSVTLPR